MKASVAVFTKWHDFPRDETLNSSGRHHSKIWGVRGKDGGGASLFNEGF